jgi:Flp pilus assembly protein TadB
MSGASARKAKRTDSSKNRARQSLTGWQLVAALCVVAAVGILTLLITHQVGAVTVVVAPLLLVLGVSATRL